MLKTTCSLAKNYKKTRHTLDHTVAQLNPGDLSLTLVDQVEEALAHIAKRVAEVG